MVSSGPATSSSPLSGYGPLTATFTDQSTTTYGTLTSWLWSFGDGVTSTQQNPMHVYSHMGAYTVRLTTGTGVYTDTETKPGCVTVNPPSGPRVITYTYDGLYRLERKGYSTGEWLEYKYDAMGNRVAYTQTFDWPVVTS